MTDKYIYSKDLSSSEKVVMTFFCSIEEKEIQLGIDTIVGELGMGENAVKRALKNLVEKGYLSRKRVGQGHPNIYRILK